MKSTELLVEKSSWEFASFAGPDPIFLVIVVLLTSLGTWGLPQMIGKFYAIKDTAAIKRGTIISTIFCIVIGCLCNAVCIQIKLIAGSKIFFHICGKFNVNNICEMFFQKAYRNSAELCGKK